MTLDMLHVMSDQRFVCDLHMIAPWQLQPTCWRQFALQWGDWKKSRIALFSVIVVVAVVAVIITIIIIINNNSNNSMLFLLLSLQIIRIEK